jgi:predicted phage gp36 major capsid-like protein
MIEATSNPSSAEPVKVENTDVVTSREAQKPKKSVRRNRNALLNSLANYNTGLATKSDSRNEIKTYSPVQDHNSSCDCALTSTYAVPDHFKNKSKFLLAAQSAGVITSRIRESEGSFKFRDEDFPPL